MILPSFFKKKEKKNIQPFECYQGLLPKLNANYFFIIVEMNKSI